MGLLLMWEDIQNGTYEDFQRHHAGLGIPPSVGDRPGTLHVLWQALQTMPNRESATEDLHSPFQVLPSLGEFTDIIQAKTGHSSGNNTHIFRIGHSI